MHYLVALLLAVFSAQACAAAEVFSTIDAYLAHATGKTDSVVSSAGKVSQDGKYVFGIVHEKGYKPRSAIIFVVRESADGGIHEVERSMPFDFSDPSARTDIESVEAQSTGRFSIQINMRTDCGVHVETYRFAKVGTAWFASGLDVKDPTCDKDGIIEWKSKRSANFLSGKVIEQQFRSGKMSSEKSKFVKFPSFSLANFKAFDEKHSPR